MDKPGNKEPTTLLHFYEKWVELLRPYLNDEARQEFHADLGRIAGCVLEEAKREISGYKSVIKALQEKREEDLSKYEGAVAAFNFLRREVAESERVSRELMNRLRHERDDFRQQLEAERKKNGQG